MLSIPASEITSSSMATTTTTNALGEEDNYDELGLSLDEYARLHPDLTKDFVKSKFRRNSNNKNRNKRTNFNSFNTNNNYRNNNFANNRNYGRRFGNDFNNVFKRNFNNYSNNNANFPSNQNLRGNRKPFKPTSINSKWTHDKYDNEVTKSSIQYQRNRNQAQFLQSNTRNSSTNFQNDRSKIIFNNLASSVDDKLLRSVLSRCEGFLGCGVHMSANGRHLGFGDASFCTPKFALDAIDFLRGKKLNGVPINVNFVKNPDTQAKPNFKPITSFRNRNNSFMSRRLRRVMMPRRSIVSVLKQKRSSLAKVNNNNSNNNSVFKRNSMRNTRNAINNKSSNFSRRLTVEDLDKELEQYNNASNMNSMDN